MRVRSVCSLYRDLSIKHTISIQTSTDFNGEMLFDYR